MFVRALTAELERARLRPIERRPKSQELVNPLRTLTGDRPHDFFAAEAGTRLHGVPRVAHGRIGRAHRCRHATLGQGTRSPFGEGGLADYQDLSMTGVDCGHQAGDTTADDDDIGQSDTLRRSR